MPTLRLLFCLLLGQLLACQNGADTGNSLTVRATAYNSLPAQTSGAQPNIGAWGDTLRPGMQCIAVSRDLIERGLNHNTEVEIEGLPGRYRVLDKMNKRWIKKIDVYMGTDRRAAREWGVQVVRITWQ